MSSEQGAVCVRVIELPAIKMVRSGKSDLDAFDRWWSAVAAQDKGSLFPRDFLWFNPQIDSFEWLYAPPPGVVDTGGYETFMFPGGLYAVAACMDEGADIERTNKLIHEWVAQSEMFAEAPQVDGPGARYDMGHVISPLNAKQTTGLVQMDLYVPLVYRRGG